MGRLKVKGQEKISCNIDQKKAKVAVLIADKVVRIKKMTRNTEENIVIKASITRRHSIVNVYALNYKAAKYEKESINARRDVNISSLNNRQTSWEKNISKSIYEHNSRAFPGSSVSQNLSVVQETQVRSLGQEDLEKEMANHSSMGFPDSSVGKESAWNAGDPGSIPGSGRSAGEGIGYPLQYSWAFLVAQLVKNPPAMRETWVRSLG